MSGDKPLTLLRRYRFANASTRYTSGTIQREVLYWYDETGTRYPTADEIAQAERQNREKLAAKLRELGIDPDTI